MSDLYPWLDEYLDQFTYTHYTTVDDKQVCLVQRYSEIDST